MSSVLATVMDGNLSILRVMLQTPQALKQTDLNRSIIYSAKHGLLECASYLVDADVTIFIHHVLWSPEAADLRINLI
ncbi:uncharacterized protein LOC124285246 isoform X3 [Haliotis rubra]|uniref:uncharacterized protein LOC124285246 isoform X3 n=1 Tax=Haliotis rubra TaxID=36100 RepID=UPI001EE5F8B8|nr:uncharacterized protein LOC124285246 isoform X3 [Haliotis rubra]